MFVFTHALLPVLAAQAAQGISLTTRKQILFAEPKSLVAIGLAGAAPDLLFLILVPATALLIRRLHLRAADSITITF